MEITAQDIKDMLQQLKDYPTYVKQDSYILPKRLFDDLVVNGTIPKNTTLFARSEHNY